jgi:hypothetical protein
MGEWRYSSILDLGTRWRWVISFTPRPFYPRGKSRRYPLGRPPEPAWPLWSRENLSPRLPSPSLYRLSYPGRLVMYWMYQGAKHEGEWCNSGSPTWYTKSRGEYISPNLKSLVDLPLPMSKPIGLHSPHYCFPLLPRHHQWFLPSR